ncbi:MAG: phosphoribosylformylglycinamidine synthase [Patescibacteria group bacterium]
MNQISLLMKKVEHFYRLINPDLEYCFNMEISSPLSSKESDIIVWLLSETFEPQKLKTVSQLEASSVMQIVEVGPLLNFATPWSTNAVSILKNCGVTGVTRLERSIRKRVASLIDISYDRMTEIIYVKPLESFESEQQPKEITYVPLLEKGVAAFNALEGLSMDEHDKETYYNYFVGKCQRNPTIAEIMDLNNANSEHSRHGYFKGLQVINGDPQNETLMEIVKSTLEANVNNSLLAFCDNSSVIRGASIFTLLPKITDPYQLFEKKKLLFHFLFTAETHNFPSGIAPTPGAETGAGGRIRDVQATGRGGLMLAGIAGYCVGNFYLKDYPLPWEETNLAYPPNLASPLEILIHASNGASDYGNKIGEPLIQGFVRSNGLFLPNGERTEWLKPIMFTGGIGQIDDRHLIKQEAEKGMQIISIGGPGYRIGFGGGSASSLMQGENKIELDFNAVQRGDPEMEQKMNRVVRACVEMGDENPIISIHDQGAGGPANVLKELVEHAGGVIDIRKINIGDSSMSILEIWVCEYQERNGLLIRPERLEEFLLICQREKVACEVLGEVTGDGHFTVFDSRDGSTPINLELKEVLGGMPQKTFYSSRLPLELKPLHLPSKLAIGIALEHVLRLPSIGSKSYLINKVDRSVTGLIAQQQGCGPLHLPVADVSVVAQSHFTNDFSVYSGAAASIGEQPIKMLVNSAAGARMAVAEALTNIVWAKLSGLGDIKCSANWMGAPKLPGEGAKMYDAAIAMRDFMVFLGIAVDGGKDSLSMATKVTDKEGNTSIVKSPLELVISAYCSVPDITKKVTPDIKAPGKSKILWVDLANGRRRLGGSALAQVYSQVGNDCPDIDDFDLFKSGFEFIQSCIDKNLILSGHDVSDGGMIVSLLEMLFSGNSGFSGKLICHDYNIIPEVFAEEAGYLVEYLPENEETVITLLADIPYQILGNTVSEDDNFISLEVEGKLVLNLSVEELRGCWEATSFELEKLQTESGVAWEERKNNRRRKGPNYHFDFLSSKEKQIQPNHQFKVAIIREEGSNGDREMASAFFHAGFLPCDVAMTDLLAGRIDLADFRGVAFVGGFSYADVLDSSKGWAGVIRFNTKLKKMFDDFYHRPDTFSLGVCNGCQLSALLGWVPGNIDSDIKQPRFIKNTSGRYESRFSTVSILPSPAIMLRDMAGSQLGIWVAHGEGKFFCPNDEVEIAIFADNLAPIRYIDDGGGITNKYPFNPNGSPFGIAALCDPSGRHLAMMPHPERTFLKWQWAYWPEKWGEEVKSPWLKMFENAYNWCCNNAK